MKRGLIVVAALLLSVPAANAGGGGVVKVAYNAKLHTKILVSGSGLTLYMYAGDYKTVSACGTEYNCATSWPAYVTSAKPKAGPGARAALLGTAKRPDGRTQVMYAGHLLYTFAAMPHPDRKPGDVYGQNVNYDWWVLAPNGKPIKKSP
jgi:predicted lipoprotein with Yx(FWY)xxD motif